MKRRVRDIEIREEDSVTEIIDKMEDSGGFVAKKFAIACKILKEMILDKDCKRFLSFPASLVSTGARGIIRDMIKKEFFDVVVTTCGTLDHDLARVWKDYYHGSFFMNDAELHRKGINREGNVVIPNECYQEILEKKVQEIVEKEYNKGKSKLPLFELIWKFGKEVGKEKNGKSSIVYWAWKNRIPIIVPAPFDGAFGYHLWLFWQANRDFAVDMMEDEQVLSDLIYNARRSGALMIGGGMSKHHTIWWNQFKDGLDYAVYITTAPEWDGSLSGARLREAVSWGKIKENAKFVTVEGDATVFLPSIMKYLIKEVVP